MIPGTHTHVRQHSMGDEETPTGELDARVEADNTILEGGRLCLYEESQRDR